MPSPRRAMLVALFLPLAFAREARAQDPAAITLTKALELARAHAPEAGAARLRIDEARGRLEGASVLLQENPSLAVALGPRLGGPAGLALDAELGQSFELGGRRTARMDGARADVDRAVAAGDDASRRARREAGIAFYRSLHARERLRLSVRAEEVAEETLRIAQWRHQAGDVPVLHVNVARGALARARSERKASEATQAALLGDLRILLGLDGIAPLVLEGELSDRSRFERTAADQVRRAERPDVQLLAAELREATADLRLGRGLDWPEVGVGVRYSREEAGVSALLGTLTLALPVFARGRGLRAEAAARERRLHFELDATRRRAGIEVGTALVVYRARVESVAELEAAAPGLQQNEALARRSYELGELGLAELLLVRREVLETQVDFLGRQLDAATAGIELEAATGVPR